MCLPVIELVHAQSCHVQLRPAYTCWLMVPAKEHLYRRRSITAHGKASV